MMSIPVAQPALQSTPVNIISLNLTTQDYKEVSCCLLHSRSDKDEV